LEILKTVNIVGITLINVALHLWEKILEIQELKKEG
jgi:hypothetical protein